MTWITKFKIAIVEQDINTLETLLDSFPVADTKEEALELRALVTEALSIVQKAKEKTLESMNKIKKTKAFLRN
ncbi:MAG: hypothetical protein PWQ42_96 [Sulfurospirillum sp.]|jgi:hypothetical protein|nr:hypothetical protein [Sulfurospirillum sp.]DAB34136.1 MAG TPA: hypothetical protein CFH82_06905 [Sulfurospirillum sp. UBA12182]